MESLRQIVLLKVTSTGVKPQTHTPIFKVWDITHPNFQSVGYHTPQFLKCGISHTPIFKVRDITRPNFQSVGYHIPPIF